MNLPYLLAGAVLLLAGRRLFWLFVAGVGFVTGALIASRLMEGTSPTMVLVAGVAVGVIGAVLSLFLQRLMILAAGFMAGGYLLHSMALQTQFASSAWLAFFIGGVLGAILLRILFDGALILLSSLVGAAVLVQNLPVDGSLSGLLFLILALVGIVAQSRGLRPRSPAAPAPPPDPA